MIRERKLLFWKIQDIWFDIEAFHHSSTTDIVVLHSDTVPSPDTFDEIIVGETLVIDLKQTIEAILQQFDKKLRWSIRKAERENIHVWQARTPSEINDFYEFFCCFCKRKKLGPPKREEFEQYDIFLAKDVLDGTFLGGCCFLKDGQYKIYRYKHGSVIYRGQENEAILWQAIQYAKQAGYEFFDLGGVSPTTDTNSYYYRHHAFKRRFSKRTEKFYALIKINNPFLRRLHILGKPLFRMVLSTRLRTLLGKIATQ